jgi:hypothetical protein
MQVEPYLDESRSLFDSFNADESLWPLSESPESSSVQATILRAATLEASAATQGLAQPAFWAPVPSASRQPVLTTQLGDLTDIERRIELLLTEAQTVVEPLALTIDRSVQPAAETNSIIHIGKLGSRTSKITIVLALTAIAACCASFMAITLVQSPPKVTASRVEIPAPVVSTETADRDTFFEPSVSKTVPTPAPVEFS